MATFVCCVCATAQAAHASSELKRPGVIGITGREFAREEQGTSPGDLEIARLRLYNRRLTRRPIGHAELVCVYLGDQEGKSCTGSFSLPQGNIVVGGTIVLSDIYELAVLGGTGLYDNVRGSLTVTSLGDRPPSFLLFFRLAV